jgi:hypothetical protein
MPGQKATKFPIFLRWRKSELISRLDINSRPRPDSRHDGFSQRPALGLG